jgi:hypothetical protein
MDRPLASSEPTFAFSARGKTSRPLDALHAG